MTAINRTLEKIDHNYPYIAIGSLVTAAAGIVLSSLILKVAGIALAAIALLGFIHEKYFSSQSLPVPSMNIPSAFAPQQAIPESVPELTTGVITPSKPPTVLPGTTQEPIHITDSIISEEQIHALGSINGILIEEIERRARPAKSEHGPNKTIETEGWSYSGFLGINESFKQVLLSDWTTVRALGWTHQDLAYHLSNIVNAVIASEDDYEVQLKYNYSDEQINLNKNYKHLNWGNYYSNNTNAGQDLTAQYMRHRGRQEDIFSPEKNTDTDGWNGVCLITNVSTGAKVMWTPGVEKYIRKYGFYEGGGKENQHRIDPIALISVLTGETEADLRKKLTS